MAGSPGVNSRPRCSTVKIEPSQDSYFEGHSGLTVDFSGRKISQITQIADGAQRIRSHRAASCDESVRQLP